MKKVFIVLMFSILIFGFLINYTYAAGDGYAWDFKQFDGQDTGDTGIMVESAGATIIAIFQVFALGIAIIMLVITGIMYVLSATGDKKAELKKHMPNYLVGVVFTFGAVAILQIVREFINENVNNP